MMMTNDVITVTISDFEAGTFICTTSTESSDMSITYAVVENVTLTN